MADLPMTMAGRRSIWAALVERRGYIRHPVSPTRNRLGAVLLILLLLGFAFYSYSTRDEAIRLRAIRFLTDATSGEIYVGSAQFRMFGGITLRDVRISVPVDKRLDPTAVDAESRQIFAAKRVWLILNPWRLLLGGLHVEQIIATQPIITLTQNVDTGMRNWQLLQGPRKAPQAKNPSDRPRITIRNARALSVSIHSDGTRESRFEDLDADVRPHPQSESGYYIHVRRFTEPAERTTVIFDPGARLVTNTPFVDARTVRLQLPKAAQQLFDSVSLEGEVKLKRFVYDARTPQSRDTDIRLRNVACAIPLSFLRSGSEAVPPTSTGATEDGVIQMTDVHGRLSFLNGRWNLDGAGSVNGAPCLVAGDLDIGENPISEMGLSLDVQGTHVPAPAGSLREQILADPNVPEAIRDIINDYNPSGPFDLAFRLIRPPGPHGLLQVSGHFDPQEAVGVARKFPYRMENLQGTVRVDSNHVLIEGLTGRHGPATAKVDADVDLSSKWANVTVRIDAENVPLDDDLFRSLSPADRLLWLRFNPRGAANLGIRLKRPGGGDADPKPPWDTRVTADLLDAEMRFAEFPYPLQKVSGRLELAPHRIELHDIVGRQEKALVHIDGYSTLGDVEKPEAQFQLSAADLRLDEILSGALPPEGKGAFAEFQPEGSVNLSGTVSLTDPQQGLVYDLRAELCNAAIRYREFPYRIENVGGVITIRPEEFSVVNVVGQHGPATMRANGNVRRNGAGYIADLDIHGDGLQLDQDLYDALPASLRHVWNLLKPAGRMTAETSLHYVSEKRGTWQRHRTIIDTDLARMCFQGFPLQLDGVRGRAIVTDQQVEILSMKGYAGPSSLELSGRIDLSGPGYRGSLVVKAKDLAFDCALLSALPEGIRTAVESMKPKGHFDLDLDEFRFDLDDEGYGHWDLNGRMVLRDAAAELGFPLRDLTGVVEGRTSVNEHGQVFVQARAELKTATLAGWQMQNAVAKIQIDPHTRTLHVQDASADAYGGEATGTAEVSLGDKHADYQASIIARDVQLSRYLQSVSDAADPQHARGAIFGNMILQGRTGSHGYREGAGEMYVRHAQVWRLPLMLAIFQVLNLTPDENVFHDGRLNFYLSGDTLTLQQIDLQGSALSFVGGGWMQLGTRQLDVTLLAGSPLRMRLPLLTDLLENAAGQLMQVHLLGSFDKPKITPQPLYNLGKALKSVFPDTPRQIGPRPIVSNGDGK